MELPTTNLEPLGEKRHLFQNTGRASWYLVKKSLAMFEAFPLFEKKNK